MTYQEYLKKVNQLTVQKDALYDIASRKLSKGDKAGALTVYSLIDEVQVELDALVDPQDEIAEELTFNFDN